MIIPILFRYVYLFKPKNKSTNYDLLVDSEQYNLLICQLD